MAHPPSQSRMTLRRDQACARQAAGSPDRQSRRPIAARRHHAVRARHRRHCDADSPLRLTASPRTRLGVSATSSSAAMSSLDIALKLNMRTADLQAGNCIARSRTALIAGQTIRVPRPVPTNTPTPAHCDANLHRRGNVGPNLRADKNPIGYRDCTTIRWDVDNIKAGLLRRSACHRARQPSGLSRQDHDLSRCWSSCWMARSRPTRSPSPCRRSAATISANRAKATRPARQTASADRRAVGRTDDASCAPLPIPLCDFCGILTAQISETGIWNAPNFRLLLLLSAACSAACNALNAPTPPLRRPIPRRSRRCRSDTPTPRRSRRRIRPR